MSIIQFIIQCLAQNPGLSTTFLKPNKYWEKGWNGKWYLTPAGSDKVINPVYDW
jgi:hypothetical protein